MHFWLCQGSHAFIIARLAICRLGDLSKLFHAQSATFNDTSITFAPAERGIGDGSSQSSNASLALTTASSSVSPRRSAPWQLREKGRPSLDFRVIFQPKFHESKASPQKTREASLR